MSGFTRDNVELELLYFDIEGKGEAIRLLCNDANLSLKDTRLSFDKFKEMKESGALSYGQVPCLVVTNKASGSVDKICQSASINRFIGKLAGEQYYTMVDPVKAALIDSIIDEENDMFVGIGVATYKGRFGFGFLADEKNESQLNSAVTSIKTEILPRHLSFLEQLLKNSKTGWLAGTDGPSICDFIFAPRMKWLQSGILDINKAIVKDGYPGVYTWYTNFYDLPSVKKYYA